ncbi:MAG: T9SS type A sorting domain-containing protein [Bacteroidetes bacterium]|nr:T9SS type A sorting domain-containing protein [Bacteroidota bacterium]
MMLLLMMAWTQVFTQNIRGFYVDGFNTILGNTAREDSLLIFAKNNGFNYLALYNVYQVHAATPLTNTSSAQVFANFIQKAKTQYSITEIGVPSENYAFLANVINVYNQQHPLATQKVDVYNLEFEFWVPSSVASGAYYCTTYLQPGGFSCDTAGAFAYYKKTLKRIDSLANANGRKSEAYFGFFNSGQGKQIVQTGVDRVLISIYVPSASYSASYQYNYAKQRLIDLAGANTNIKVMPLYSAEPSFMQSWVMSNPFFQPYTSFASSLSAETGAWKNVIQPEGIQWFAYSFMPKKNLTTRVEEQNNNQLFTIYPNPSSGTFELPSGGKETVRHVVVSDLSGKVVYETQISSGTVVLNRCIENGVYSVKIISGTTSWIQKLVITR